VLDRGEVEAREVIELEALRIGQHGLEVRGVVGAARSEPDEVLVSLPVGDLDHAQTIARGDEPHRLGVDGNGPRREDALGEIFLVEIDSHGAKMLRGWVSVTQWAPGFSGVLRA